METHLVSLGFHDGSVLQFNVLQDVLLPDKQLLAQLAPIPVGMASPQIHAHVLTVMQHRDCHNAHGVSTDAVGSRPACLIWQTSTFSFHVQLTTCI